MKILLLIFNYPNKNFVYKKVMRMDGEINEWLIDLMLHRKNRPLYIERYNM